MLTAFWRKVFRYRGAFVIVLYQAVPIGTDSAGRTRVGIGAGAASLEYANMDCAGNVLNTTDGKIGNVAAEIEHHFDHGLLIHASVARQWADSASERGHSAAVTVGKDFRKFGIHAGVISTPRDDGYVKGQLTYPSGVLRFGNY